MGSLLSYNSEGIFQFPLETGRPTYLLSWPSDVLTKHASFSPDGNKVVFWQQSETTSELWFSELEPWSPELLLTLPETNYESAGSDWLGTKRYIRFSLGRPNELGIHTVVATYLIDTQKKEVVETLSGWETMCPILAFSPRSKRVATWCSSDQGASYLVVETEGELWTTTELPDRLLVNKEQNSLGWSWSNNAEHVVFTEFINDTFDKQLYFTSSENDLPIRLSNVKGTYFHNFSLSANGDYLSNFSTCPDGIGCTLIIHIPSGEIVWTSQAIPYLGPGIIPAWSPDGNYFVTSDFNLSYIIELPTGQIIQEIDAVPHETLVWR
jgi:Tol biopolymer transport system component